jgi:hypothetical protein
MCRQIQMADSDVEMGSAADIGNRRLRMDQELATATRGRVQLVFDNCIYGSLDVVRKFTNIVKSKLRYDRRTVGQFN